MNFTELATRRYSVRNFKPDPIEQEKLLVVLEAARLAPSAANYQPWQFIVVTEPEILQSLHAAYPRKWMETAPAIIVALGDHNLGWHRPADGKDFTAIDVAISIDHLTLAAAESGLGTCWVCNFDPAKCRQLFNLSENLEPVALIPIGYPDETPKPVKQRKPIEQLIHWNHFGNHSESEETI